MSECIAGTSITKGEVATDGINRLLNSLVLRCYKGWGVADYFEVDVIGYGSNLSSVFSGVLTGQPLIKISKVAKNPLRIEKRRRQMKDNLTDETYEVDIEVPVWVEPVASGKASIDQVIILARAILEPWVQDHPTAFPPLVINITGGQVVEDPLGLIRETDFKN